MKSSEKLQRSGLVTGAATIGALASPARQEIVDTVEALGGAATIAEVAEQLGRPADGLYYHVRRLVRAGLLVADGGTGVARYRTPPLRGGSLMLDYQAGDRRNAAAVERVVGGMLRIAKRDFDAALATPGVVTRGPRRALWAARCKSWVSPATLAEVNVLLKRLTSRLRRPRRRGDVELVSFCFVLAPIAVKPARRSRRRGRRRVRRRRGQVRSPAPARRAT